MRLYSTPLVGKPTLALLFVSFSAAGVYYSIAPAGQCCAHLRCAAWSDGVCRGEGQSLLYVDKAIDSGSTEVSDTHTSVFKCLVGGFVCTFNFEMVVLSTCTFFNRLASTQSGPLPSVSTSE